MRRVLLAMLVAITTVAPVLADPAAPLTISEALAQADARNPDIAAARSDVDIARAGLTQTAPTPLQADATKATTQDVPLGLGPLQTFSAGLTQQLSPTTGAQRSAAAAAVEVAQAQLAGVRLDVDRRVVAAYYGLASAQAVVVAAVQSVQNASAFERSAALRARVGAVGNFEVLRAQVERRRAQTDLLRSQAQERTADIALDVLIGRSGDVPNAVTLALPQSTTTDLGALYAKAQRIDPELSQFRAGIRQAIAQQRVALLQRAPSLGLSAGYLFQRAPGSGGVTSRGPTTAITLSVPLFDYGTIRGAAAEARARQAQARAHLQGRDAALRGEIETDVAEIESAQARLTFSRESLTQAQEALRLAQFGYDRGALGILDVVTARNEVALAQSEVTRASADLGASIARLHLIVGEPVSP
ncbi:MAG: TolC family protein [Candidatus Tumulicola sp.]